MVYTNDLGKEYRKALKFLEEQLSKKYDQKESELQKNIVKKENEIKFDVPE